MVLKMVQPSFPRDRVLLEASVSDGSIEEQQEPAEVKVQGQTCKGPFARASSRCPSNWPGKLPHLCIFESFHAPP